MSITSFDTAGTPHFGSDAPLRRHNPKMTMKKYATPAPGHYNVDSIDMVKFKNSAKTSFGGNLAKVDRSKTGLQAEAYKNASLPGPDKYSVPSAFPHKPKSPSHSFGVRLPPGELTPSTSKCVGPGSYSQLSSMGTQSASMRPSSSQFSMGTATREKVAEVLSPGFKAKSRSITPAPDRYGTYSTMGRQYSSTAKSAAGYTFGGNGGISPISKRSGKIGPGPGPGEYAWSSTIGIQSTSRFKTSSGFKFGTSERPGLETGSVG